MCWKAACAARGHAGRLGGQGLQVDDVLGGGQQVLGFVLHAPQEDGAARGRTQEAQGLSGGIVELRQPHTIGVHITTTWVRPAIRTRPGKVGANTRATACPTCP